MKILVIGAGVSALFFASFMDEGDITVIEKNEFDEPGHVKYLCEIRK